MNYGLIFFLICHPFPWHHPAVLSPFLCDGPDHEVISIVSGFVDDRDPCFAHAVAYQCLGHAYPCRDPDPFCHHVHVCQPAHTIIKIKIIDG